jgi:hypothetical protein
MKSTTVNQTVSASNRLNLRTQWETGGIQVVRMVRILFLLIGSLAYVLQTPFQSVVDPRL